MKQNPVLHEAVLKSDTDEATLAIKDGSDLNELDNLGNSPLHWAVMGGDIDMVKLLLEAGANPNVISDDGYTPKWSAMDFGLTEIIALLDSYNAKVLTDSRFDKTSWSIFKEAIGQQLPEEDTITRKSVGLKLAKFFKFRRFF
jgi:ankyrin repeat protein